MNFIELTMELYSSKSTILLNTDWIKCINKQVIKETGEERAVVILQEEDEKKDRLIICEPYEQVVQMLTGKKAKIIELSFETELKNGHKV